jgi:hypothetical protein
MFAPFSAYSAVATSFHLTVETVWADALDEDAAVPDADIDSADADELEAGCDPHPANASDRAVAAATAAILFITASFLPRFRCFDAATRSVSASNAASIPRNERVATSHAP